DEVDWPFGASYEWIPPDVPASVPSIDLLQAVAPDGLGSADAPAGTPAGPLVEPLPPIVPIAPDAPMPTPASLGIPPVAIRRERRQALCVGIDRYPDPKHRLAGCVADARTWSEVLSRLGFETKTLTDGDATRDAIERELERLVANSRAGDVLVFQYSGHGTHLPDLDADEDD